MIAKIWGWKNFDENGIIEVDVDREMLEIILDQMEIRIDNLVYDKNYEEAKKYMDYYATMHEKLGKEEEEE